MAYGAYPDRGSRCSGYTTRHCSCLEAQIGFGLPLTLEVYQKISVACLSSRDEFGQS